MSMTNQVLEFIRQGWPATVRSHRSDEGTLLGLPYPYTVPCARNAFQELYYWDTYFACRGMALQGFSEQVKNNCDNLLYEVERYGFVPNGNRTYFLNRSQPPLLGALLELVSQLYPHEREWLAGATATLTKEVSFWKRRRLDPIGLNHYGSDPGEAQLEEFYDLGIERLGFPRNPTPEERRAGSLELLAEAESGWDFTPRYERRCPEFAAVDLNSLLFQMRRELGLLQRDLGDLGHSDEWFQRADTRRELVNRYCWCEEQGVFLDYDMTNKRHARLLSGASLFPLWTGLATREQAESTLAAVESRLECEFGLAACEKNDSGLTYQWDYPNGWPPLQFIAIEGFARYGLHEAATRIARKYLQVVNTNFEQSGDLWEKYNVVDGTTVVKGEYEMPRMLGWTAGTYVFAADYLQKQAQAR